MLCKRIAQIVHHQIGGLFAQPLQIQQFLVLGGQFVDLRAAACAARAWSS